MNKIIVGIVVLVAAVILLSFTGRTTINDGEVGVRLGPGKAVAVFASGERPLVVPGLHRMIRLTTRPVAFTMAGVGGIVVAAGEQEKRIDCRLRYQVVDAARLIARFGTDQPQTNLENDLRQQVTSELATRLAADPHALDSPASRIPFIAETHHQLDTTFQADGVTVLSFELLGWD